MSNLPAPANAAVFPSRSHLRLRLGHRQVTICRDFRKRFYCVNPLFDCGAGLERGYLEILVLRRWLFVLTKAH